MLSFFYTDCSDTREQKTSFTTSPLSPATLIQNVWIKTSPHVCVEEQRGKKKLISDILYRAVTIRQKCIVAAGELKRRSAHLGFYEKFSLFEVELKKKKNILLLCVSAVRFAIAYLVHLYEGSNRFMEHTWLYWNRITQTIWINNKMSWIKKKNCEWWTRWNCNTSTFTQPPLTWSLIRCFESSRQTMLYNWWCWMSFLFTWRGIPVSCHQGTVTFGESLHGTSCLQQCCINQHFCCWLTLLTAAPIRCGLFHWGTLRKVPWQSY